MSRMNLFLATLDFLKVAWRGRGWYALWSVSKVWNKTHKYPEKLKTMFIPRYQQKLDHSKLVSPEKCSGLAVQTTSVLKMASV